ncbi:MAG: pyridoxamine 5'-phosphate oxidase family protein [Actinomycetes bacterium]
MNAELTADHVVHNARTIMTTGAGLCFLMTQHAPDRIDARFMQPFGPDPQMVLWFGTGPNTRKVHDLRRNPHATVSYQSGDGDAYVSLSGSVLIEDDAVLRAGLWRSDWTQFFPGGPEQGYILLKFTPDRIEVLDFPQQLAPDPFGVKAAAAVRVGGGWELATDY